jgi:ABC-type glycerol-3-phosphate transport system permease component
MKRATMIQQSAIQRSPGSSARMASYLMLAPALILFALFIAYPLINTVISSLFDYGLTSRTRTFVGAQNFLALLRDPIFWICFRNNLIILLGSVVFQVGGGLVLAAIFNRGLSRRWSTLAQTIVFVPMVMSSVAVGILWQLVFNPSIGVADAVLNLLRLPPPMLGWLGDPTLAILSILFVACWQYTGFMMVILLAGMQAVPAELYEAATLDGASEVQSFFWITIPVIRNVTIAAVLITMIGSFKARHVLVQERLQPQPHGVCERRCGGAARLHRDPQFGAASPSGRARSSTGQGCPLMPSINLKPLLYLGLGAYLILMVLPFVWLLVSSLKTTSEMFSSPFALPAILHWSNFAEAWQTGVAKYLLNSLFVTALSVAAILVVSGLAAYALARSEFPGRTGFYILLITGYAIPIHTVLVPLYEMLRAANALNSFAGLILPYVAFGIPFSVLLLYAFFLDFPKELEEAARLDGCNEWQLLARVVAPLSLPGLSSVAIFQGVFIWNEFLLALILISDDGLKTLPFGLVVFQGSYASNWPLLLASVTMATLPILILYLVLQRQFVNSLAGIGK